MIRNDLRREYFEWLCGLIGGEGVSKGLSYRKLLESLFFTPFRYSIKRDKNRAADGEEMRYRFATVRGIDHRVIDAEFHTKRCSVLEMMVALAVRCEETIMDDPYKGNRTGQWFWGMVVSLGLGSMLDDNFDDDYFHFTMDRFLNREYEPNGKGGLFTIRNCNRDVREVEIWHQMCWYLDTMA